MKIACLCPTYGRPQALIENTIACFLAQTHEDKELIIYDDTPGRQAVGVIHPSVQVFGNSVRSPSLPAKYNQMLTLFKGGWDATTPAWKWIDGNPPDAIAVWEDDDVYLPWHLQAINFHLSRGDEWHQHPLVYSTYTGKVLQENSKGRFHASLGISWKTLQDVGGWPDTKRADFDQQLIANLTAISSPNRGLTTYAPSYVFRWADSGARHGQELMRAPDDETWYDRFEPQNTEPFVNLTPRFDDSTKAIFAELNIPLPELQGAMA